MFDTFCERQLCSKGDGGLSPNGEEKLVHNVQDLDGWEIMSQYNEISVSKTIHSLYQEHLKPMNENDAIVNRFSKFNENMHEK